MERTFAGQGTAVEEDLLEDIFKEDIGHMGYIDREEKVEMGLLDNDKKKSRTIEEPEEDMERTLI